MVIQKSYKQCNLCFSAILVILQYTNNWIIVKAETNTRSNDSALLWRKMTQNKTLPTENAQQEKRTKKFDKKYTKQNLNKLLSIHNDTDFERKVVKMMKEDDSDVLKDINEDEEPVGKNNDPMSIGITGNADQSQTRYSRSELFKPDLVYQLKLSSHEEEKSWKRTNIAKYENSSQNPIQDSSSNIMMRNFPNFTDYTNFGPPPLESQDTSQPTPNVQLATTPTKPVQYSQPSRLCKPGPPIPANPYLPNCLIIGDSIAASYFYAVSEALRGRCVVQLSPYSKAGAALDSRYGLQCLQLLLATTDLQPTHYDVVIFNFGLHDINYKGTYVEEYVGEKEYARNLGRIKKKLLQSGASVTFALTTPVTYDRALNDYVVKYNQIAKRVMDKGTAVDSIDLYQVVIDECGSPPFERCYMTKKPKDVHYSVAGSIMLGKRVAAEIAKILQSRGQWAPAVRRQMNMSNPLYDLRPGSLTCPMAATRCPYNTVCFPNVVSRSGYGCCMLRNGVDCQDSWHCCPTNTRCHPQCKETWCTCIS